MPVWCPKCNAMLAEGQVECPVCGARLGGESGAGAERSAAIWIALYTLGIALVPVILAALIGIACYLFLRLAS